MCYEQGTRGARDKRQGAMNSGMNRGQGQAGDLRARPTRQQGRQDTKGSRQARAKGGQCCEETREQGAVNRGPGGARDQGARQARDKRQGKVSDDLFS